MSNGLLGSTLELGVLLMLLRRLQLGRSRSRVERGEEYNPITEQRSGWKSTNLGAQCWASTLPSQHLHLPLTSEGLGSATAPERVGGRAMFQFKKKQVLATKVIGKY